MAGLDAQVQGVQEVLDALDRVAAGLVDGLPADTASAGAQFLAGVIAADAPFWTGRLAHSVTGVVAGSGFQVQVGAPYAGYVQARTHWITRDLAGSEADLVRIITAGLAGALTRT